MLSGTGHEVSSTGVARLYQGIASLFVLDETDATEAAQIESLGVRTVVTNTLMKSPVRARKLAATVLAELGAPPPKRQP